MQFLDVYYMLLSAIITVIWQFLFFLIACTFRFDKVTDLAYGTNFFIISIACLLLNGTYYMRQIIVTICITLWGLRLAIYLFVRINIIGKDDRFDQWRDKPLLFLRFWIFQAITIWIVHLPSTILLAPRLEDQVDPDPPLGAVDVVGWAIFMVGLLVETVADFQKFVFRQNELNSGLYCNRGIWSWSRHPNYFGEFLVWIGLFICSIPILQGAEWISILCPIYLILTILFLSGVSRLEKSSDKRYGTNPGYYSYKNKTSALIPIPPIIYKNIPFCCQVICCCEWKIFNEYKFNKSEI
eukprot:TRINITY_DN11201_c0_g1_i1.p1 TRINITY_DN11201_c0_g1~~TRINITY_DN11201_c0_g1_i1.p1  ORF type:complete len:297 (-),score=25.47 TRINITY_DN11201_c0_g1_i1:40-930(-)